MYTHDRLWPQLSDLAALLGSECNIVDPDSGGNCFDEACSSPWAKVADKYPDLPVPMACQSTTVELRGVYDVSSAVCAPFL
jgi:predicted deacylase